MEYVLELKLMTLSKVKEGVPDSKGEGAFTNVTELQLKFKFKA